MKLGYLEYQMIGRISEASTEWLTLIAVQSKDLTCFVWYCFFNVDIMAEVSTEMMENKCL